MEIGSGREIKKAPLKGLAKEVEEGDNNEVRRKRKKRKRWLSKRLVFISEELLWPGAREGTQLAWVDYNDAARRDANLEVR